MVAPGFLANPEVIRWLNGVMPAWTMLEYASFNALHQEPSARNGAIRLEPKLTETDLSGSAVTRTAVALLQRAAADGLKLTQAGNLSRAVVAEMVESVEWPGFNKNEAFVLHKVINEPDFFPLHVVRLLLQRTKLVRVNRDKLVASRLGKTKLVPDTQGVLQALLFHVALWHLNLGYFDRNPIEAWPQTHVGVVLWSLSASANEWMDRETLTRLSTVPIIGLLGSDWDLGSYAMESRILKPLLWFGLLECRTERPVTSRLIDRRLYRKTSLFDRFVKFNVQVERPATQH